MLAVPGADDGALEILIFAPWRPVAQVDGRKVVDLAQARPRIAIPIDGAVPAGRI